MTALHSEEYRRFAAALVDARVKSGITQYELARRLNVDQSYISKYENCQRRLDVVEFMQIILAIGVDYQSILQPMAAKRDPRP